MIALVLALALAAPAPAKPERKPLDIRADHLTVLTKQNQGQWKGHVHAVRAATPEQAQLDLHCDELLTDFAGEDQLKKATCTGNVEVIQGDRKGWGEVAVYDAERGTVVVTGNPHGMQGPNKFRGEVLTFFVDEDRIEITHPIVDTTAPGSADAKPPGGAK